MSEDRNGAVHRTAVVEGPRDDEHPPERMIVDERKRWRALLAPCLGGLMIVLDTTIVNVALPSIREDLVFSEASLAWVINAYVLTYGGSLLLGGRLGDIFGHRRVFLLGIVCFTLASLGCGLAGSQRMLIAARAFQGVSGAVVSAVSLSVIMELFIQARDRAKALGFFGFVSVGGGSLGMLLGGVLSSVVNWHWIFLVNLPIGVVVYALGRGLLSENPARRPVESPDIAGAVTVTASLMLAVYAILGGNGVGWTGARTLVPFAYAVALMIVFLGIEARVRMPIMPFGLFRLPNLVVTTIVGALWSAAVFGSFFNSTLYLQRVLQYSPLEIGLAFLPGSVVGAVFSLGLSAKFVMRFGVKGSLVTGLILVAVGLVLLGQAPVNGTLIKVLPGLVLFGLGNGVVSGPLTLAAMGQVSPSDSGVVSGVVNTVLTMAGAFGLAVLASVAAARTKYLIGFDVPLPIALNSGYHAAFCLGAGFAVTAAWLSVTFLRVQQCEMVNIGADGIVMDLRA